MGTENAQLMAELMSRLQSQEQLKERLQQTLARVDSSYPGLRERATRTRVARQSFPSVETALSHPDQFAQIQVQAN
ncbi:hypothetical protein [Pedosphaera parvula]|uniref:Uncharacterized protein n=1 Tax=Pedosphaera parvula (strain Ellin514) TaxID=320771 RepID=B9XJU9_PEDPL|nr:hypothetical protein [Pedosphaera parvula]EEF59975.1 hypothetical protein Cflav_PD2779 [Pedosphaera parvula Ellin514]